MSADFDRWQNQLDPDAKLCTCGHIKAKHEHYRPGTDCGTCTQEVCTAFRQQVTEHDRERQEALRSRRVWLIIALFTVAFWAVVVLAILHLIR